MTFHTAIAIADQTQVGQARRAAHSLADAIGLSESKRGSVGIVVTELATNLLRYAKAGQLLLGTGPTGLDILAVDKGPGLNVIQCMQDGFSTGGTPGNGLGAVRRMSDEFDIYSTSEHGTAVFTRIGSETPLAAGRLQPFQWGAVSIPAPGETVCGDGWRLSVSDAEVRVMVADGLGHGPEAAVAAQAAIDTFQQAPAGGPKRFIEQAHRAMTATRGAALAAGHYSLPQKRLCYAGVGNISATLLSHQDSRGLMSHNGIVGGQMRTVHELDYDWASGWLLIMHSDGIQSRWDLGKYPGLFARHPAILAAVLARDFNRGRDDATVVVVRRN